MKNALRNPMNAAEHMAATIEMRMLARKNPIPNLKPSLIVIPSTNLIYFGD
jgi:hypothetical protein